MATEAKLIATALLGAEGHTFVDFGDDAYTTAGLIP